MVDIDNDFQHLFICLVAVDWVWYNEWLSNCKRGQANINGKYQRQHLRYKFCVLRAGSRCGKSTLAKSLHHCFPWKPPYTQTVQDEAAADLWAFSQERHGYIVFDNVNSSRFILSQRAMMQSNCDVHLGQSKTWIYSYSVYLHAVPIIFTVEHSAERDGEEPWLSENMVLIELTEPCFEGADL